MLPFNIYLILKELLPLLQIYESSGSYKNLKIHLLLCLHHEPKRFNPDQTIFFRFILIFSLCSFNSFTMLLLKYLAF